MFRLVKMHKRLWIVDEDLTPVYSPPNHVRVNSREDMRPLVDAWNAGTPWGEILSDFEAKFRKRKTI